MRIFFVAIHLGTAARGLGIVLILIVLVVVFVIVVSIRRIGASCVVIFTSGAIVILVLANAGALIVQIDVLPETKAAKQG